MHTPPRILVVDDQPQNVQILKDRLEAENYEILTAITGEAALEMAREAEPDLILLDVIMPGMDGIEVCRRLKENMVLPFMPVIMITAKSGAADIAVGFEAGADEYLTKPLNEAALIARVKSMLRLKSFHDTACDQATQREVEAAALERWNETLEDQIQKQMTELESMGLLKQFLSPQLAEWVVSLGDEEPSVNQRREITALCCVVHGLKTFVNMMEPEIIHGLLKDYHKSIGQLMTQFGGYLERFVGDELLVIFNAPLLCSDPVLHAVDMAVELREQLTMLTEEWRSNQYSFDFGMGIVHGEATLELIDFDGQWGYAVMGSVQDLASRLSVTAQNRKILVSQSVWERMEERFKAEPVGELTLSEETDPVPIFEVIKGKL